MFSARVTVALFLCCALSLTTGCSTSQFINPDTTPFSGAFVSGHVNGGQQPITGATVQLWAVGTGAYGSAASPLGSSVPTDRNGNFTLGSYTCTPGTQTYITAQGGDPGLGAGTNSNIMLMAALGDCANLTGTTNIVINEITTVAGAYALGQYFTPVFGAGSSDSFGSPGTTQAMAGIRNAMLTASTLANSSTGNVVTSNILTSATAGTITVTPESDKLLAIADILATCVNSAGGTTGCGTLFADVTPTAATQPSDTLQAAVSMSLNPTSTNAIASATNIAQLCGLVTATPAFPNNTCPTANAPSVAPTDWTLGIQYQGSGNTLLLSSPFGIASDAGGNIWVLDQSSSSGFANASLTELSPVGAPMLASNLQTTIGSTTFTLASNNPRNIAIDTNGNVFIPTTTSTANLFEYTNTGSVLVSPSLSKSTYGIAIDGNNNVFVSEESSSPHFSFFEFVGGTLDAAHQVEFANTSPIFQVEQLAIDTLGNVWATPQGSGSTGVLELSNINISSCGTAPFTTAPCVLPASSNSANTYTVTTSSSLGAAWGIAASPTGIWTANSGNSTLVNLTGSGPATSTVPFGGTSSLTTPGLVAVDGAGNIWVTNKVSSPGAISEFSSAGAILSPSGTPVGFVHPGLGSGQDAGITIDPSGNVWTADYATSGATAFSVFEMVGAAAPTIAPLAAQLKSPATPGQKP
jgi:hypothetical protein